MRSQKIYDIVESLVAESSFRDVVGNDYILEVSEEIEEEIGSEEYSTFEIKQLVRDRVDEIQEHIIYKYDITEDELNDFIVVSDELGYDLKYILESKDDVTIYQMDLDEFIEMLITEWQILGEVNEKALHYIDYEDVWKSLVQYDFADTSVGYVNTNI